MFAKIAVPLDGSPCSDEALEVALKLAKNESAELAICSIVDPLVVTGTIPPSPAVHHMLAACETESHRLVAAAVERAHCAGIKAEGETHYGLPFDEILRFAKRQNADAIVMGTHGRSGLKRLIFGSVAESVLRGARCPVIVVRHVSGQAAHS